MPKSPCRKFNADRFLDKFKCFEGVLRRYCDQWREGLDGFSEMLTVEIFKEWLRSLDMHCFARARPGVSSSMVRKRQLQTRSN